MGIPNGSLSLQLNTDAVIIAAPGGLVPASLEIVFQFDAMGNLVSGSQIYSNLELNPQNASGLGTYYLATLYDANGARLNKTPMNWIFPEATGSTVNISTMTPFMVGGNVIFYPSLSAYPTQGACVITNAANPATLNLTTAGGRDWLAPNGVATIPRQLTTPHAKALREGPGLLNTFDYIFGQATGTTSTGTHSFTNPSMTATVPDDLGSGGLSAQTGGQGISNNSTATGWGFRVIVPADTFQRTLTLYTSIFSAAVTVTVSVSDGSFTTKTLVFDSGSATTVEEAFQIVYNSGRDGQWLMVDVVVTTNHGSTPAVNYAAMTLN